MLEPLALLLAAGACALGALVQGSVGFGFALVAAPLLALIEPRLVPGALTVASAGLGVISIYRTRRGPTDWPGVRWAGAGLVPGTVGAGFLLAGMSRSTVTITVGVLVLLAVALSLAGLEIHRTPGNLLLVGAISGFMGTAATVGGPPIAMAYQREPGAVIRATLARYFLLGTVLAVFALVPAGRLGWEHALAGLALIPGVVVGFLLSRRLAGKLDGGWTRPAILWLSAVSSVAVLARELI